MELTKEEIMRVNLIHRRADEALLQMKAGHVITTTVVLHESESDSGEVTWTESEIRNWETHKPGLLKLLHRHRASGGTLSIMDKRSMDTYVGRLGELNTDFEPQRVRGRCMYHGSEAYLKTFPPADPYNTGLNDKGVAESMRESDQQRKMSTLRAELDRPFPVPGRNPR